MVAKTRIISAGWALYLPVLIVFSKDRDHARKTALQHLALTHGGPAMARGGALIADILLDVLYGRSLPDAILSRDVLQPATGIL
ncbi:MAG: ADP-ribosylglycohydrolase family protein [Desulfobacterales bacterium]